MTAKCSVLRLFLLADGEGDSELNKFQVQLTSLSHLLFPALLMSCKVLRSVQNSSQGVSVCFIVPQPAVGSCT